MKFAAQRNERRAACQICVRCDVIQSRECERITVKSSLIICGLIALLSPSFMPARALPQSANQQTAPLLRTDSAFVWVPVLIKDDRGASPPGIRANGLRLYDNGVPEKALRVDTNGLPISLVILMQTGGEASRYLSSYLNLPGLIGALAGESVHEITLVTFDSHIKEIWHFPARTDGVDYALTHQHPGDGGAAIRDAIDFGVRQLQGEPGRFRRVVLLIGQSSDAGSSTPAQSLLEQLGSSSTVVYSAVFPVEEQRHERRHQKHHDVSNEGALDRIHRALDNKTAEEAASLTGGASFQFEDLPGFNSAMLQILSDFHNTMTFGFQPSRHQTGFHSIEVQTASRKLRATARAAYWIANSQAEPAPQSSQTQ